MLIFISTNVVADDSYTIYLVRHAEKDLSNLEERDPKLTACGVERAKKLVSLFSGIELNAVYSTDFIRTQNTAKPTANAKSLDVISYDPFNLKILHKQLMTNEHSALVVGHSQTTNALAGMLAGIELDVIDEKEYDRLYQVSISEKVAKFQLLAQAFQCNK